MRALFPHLWMLALLSRAEALLLAHRPLGTAFATPRCLGTAFATPRCRVPRAADAVDVSDLGLTLDDLDAELSPDVALGITTEGYESSSGLNDDRGVRWSETATRVEAELTIPGLRGQPADSLSMQVTEDTAAVLGFGRAVWTCILRGKVDASSARVEVVAPPQPGGVPTIKLAVDKLPGGAERWGGFVESIGVDSILQ